MASTAWGIQSKKIDGLGTLWCQCGGGSGDSCKFVNKSGSGGFSRLGCEGEMELTPGELRICRYE